MEEIDILKKLKISNGVNGLNKEGDLLSEIIKVKWLSINSCVSVLCFFYFKDAGNMLKQKSPARRKIAYESAEQVRLHCANRPKKSIACHCL
jgi:hypothetical protein